MKHSLSHTTTSVFADMDPVYKTMLDTICERVYSEAYLEAENMLLSVIKKIYDAYESPAGHTNQDILVSQVIYVEFNDYFEHWMEENGHMGNKDIEAYKSEEHDNVLLANCTDPASMDDLFWDLTNLLTSNNRNYVMDDIDYHIACYRRDTQQPPLREVSAASMS